MPEQLRFSLRILVRPSTSIAGDEPAANSLGLRKETALIKLQSLVEQAADTVIRRQPLPAGIQVAANKAIGN